MPTPDQKTAKSNHKRGSLTGDKSSRKSTNKKKKKAKKSGKSEPSQEYAEILEVEGLTFPKECEDSDSSNNKTPLVPKLSASDITINSEATTRPVSTDSLSTRSSNTRQTDTGSTLTHTKSLTDALSVKLSNVSLKSKTSKSKTKSANLSKKEYVKNSNKKTTEVKLLKATMPNIIETPQILVKDEPLINESIRWKNELRSSDFERDRINLYKINRRKRYLASAQVKGLGWVKQYGVNGFPLTDDSAILDTRRDIAVISNYLPLSVVRKSQSHSILNEGKVVTYGH